MMEPIPKNKHYNTTPAERDHNDAMLRQRGRVDIDKALFLAYPIDADMTSSVRHRALANEAFEAINQELSQENPDEEKLAELFDKQEKHSDTVLEALKRAQNTTVELGEQYDSEEGKH